MPGPVAIFDDDEVLLRLLHDVFESEGLSVVVCRSLLEVHQAAVRGARLAIVDSWGPGHLTLDDGERQQILALSRLVPTVFITGRTWANAVSAAELGLLALLPKPFDLQVLLDLAAPRPSNEHERAPSVAGSQTRRSM